MQKFKRNGTMNIKKPISLHFRIGDYVKNLAMHPVLSTSYYINCIKYLKSLVPDLEEHYYLLVFGELCDNEIQLIFEC
jgi:hypothetical protein